MGWSMKDYIAKLIQIQIFAIIVFAVFYLGAYAGENILLSESPDNEWALYADRF